MLRVGSAAPLFTAQDQCGKVHSLSSYQGKWVLLYFYPKDNTPGCTTEACNFRDSYALLSQKVTILGVSADSLASHTAFTKKYSLPFPLLIDTDKSIITHYEAGGFLPKRVSFIIDPKGIIAKIYPKVDPKAHATEILKDINELIK
jgi:peroxiredoxin Q/BCP